MALSRFDREAGRQKLLGGGHFTGAQTEALLDAAEAAHRKRWTRLLSWPEAAAWLGGVAAPGLAGEQEERQRLRARLEEAGFTARQARTVVEAVWLGFGVGIYRPGDLFPPEARALRPGRRVTGAADLDRLAGAFERARSSSIGPPRIGIDPKVTPERAEGRAAGSAARLASRVRRAGRRVGRRVASWGRRLRKAWRRLAGRTRRLMGDPEQPEDPEQQ